MRFLDLSALRARPIATEPYQHVVVPHFLRPDAAQAVRADFPDVDEGGLTPIEEVRFGPAFDLLMQELRSATLAATLSETFGIDLVDRPLMIHIRSRCQAKDGRIHTDSRAKLVTALLYMNEPWLPEGGRLRILRGPDRLDDYAAEVAPDQGTLVAFRRAENSWHGHAPFIGTRRYVMLNWMTSRVAASRETLRHRLSARFKRLAHPQHVE